MPQQLADLTLAEVEDFVPAMAPVLAPIFGAIGVSRYPTKPIAMAVLVHSVSICTYLQGSQPLTYPKVLSAIMSGKLPQAYTTIKTEKQLEENLMGLLRARTHKASPLPREHGPVKRYAALLSLDGFPFRFPWSQETLRKIIKVSTSASPYVDPLYSFRCITFPNRYWKEPVRWPRTRHVGRAPDCLEHNLQHLDLVLVPGWIESAAQVRHRNLKCRIAPFKRDPVWQPEGKMTMSGDMQLVMHDVVNTVLGPEARAEWEELCLEIEIASFPHWKRACELWNQANWVSKRVALAVNSRADVARQQAFAPAMPAPVMAMSLDQPVTIALPTHIQDTEPISPPIIQGSTEGGHTTAELTPDLALIQPIADLNMPETSNSEAMMTAMSPGRSASVSTANGDAVKGADKDKLRRNSAQ